MAQAKKIFALYDAKGDLNKNWFVWYYQDGKRIRKYGDINQAETIEERHERAQNLIKTLQKTISPDAANRVQVRKLQTVLDNKKNHLRRKTVQSYQSKLNNLLKFANGREISNDLLKDFFAHIGNTQKAGTVHDAYFSIKRILRGEGLEGMMSGITPPSFSPVPMRFYQRHQVEQIVRYLSEHDKPLLLWCKFVYYCFLRPRSELRLLRVQDIYFENREIVVPGTISKNKKTEPVIIPDAFWPDVAPLQHVAPGRFIFPGKKKNMPTGYNTMGHRYQLILQQLGYDTSLYGVYSWKHTGAVEFYKATKDLVGLQAQLRHHSLDQGFNPNRCG